MKREKVLIGYDDTSDAGAALDDLRRAGLPREAEALIVSVSDGLVSTTSSIDVGTALPSCSRVRSTMAMAREQALHLLGEARRFATKASRRVRSYFPDWEVRYKVLDGSPSRELVQQIERWQPDLVVVGSQGRSALGRFFLGSVSTKVATESRSSVRVARRKVENSDGAPPRIMIGVDGSPGAERAVRSVGRRVWPEGTKVRIIAVDDSTSPERISGVLATVMAIIRSSNEKVSESARVMAEWAQNELRAIGLQVSTAIEKGEPKSLLIEEGLKWKADSIFVGAHGLDHLDEKSGLGSVSKRLVTNAPFTVEVVR